MAFPYVEATTRVLIGSNLISVRDLDISDLVRAGMVTGGDSFPLKFREVPHTGALSMATRFTKDLRGSGTAGSRPVDGALWPAAGLTETIVASTSVTLEDLRDLATTATTVKVYVGNAILFNITAALTDLSVEFRANQPCKARYSIQGSYTEPTEATDASSLATEADAIICKNLAVTVASDDLILQELDVMMGNDILMPFPNISAPHGTSPAILTNSAPTARVLAALPDPTDANYWTDLTAENGLAVSCVLGTVAGNIGTFTFTLYQSAAPRLSNANGVVMVELAGEIGGATGEPFKVVWT